jgi:RNA polymerase subunit RPABC4/transcription elongation factor Spt4
MDELYYCVDCEEEYLLPDDTEQCPICNNNELICD